MVAKLGKVVTWSHDLILVKWYIDKFMHPLLQELLPLNLAVCWLQEGGSGLKHPSQRRI